MLTVMIVDDETMVRIGIKSCIDWEQNGFELVGEASNGQEALQLFDKLKPDIILTDIRMPLLDGIDLIKEIAAQSPSTKCIVLSCLNEYDYVREAMKYGAIDYLFKPTMNPEDILKVLNEVKEKLANEKSKRKEIEELEHRAKQSLSLLRENFLNHLLHRDKDIENMETVSDELRELNIQLEEKQIVCFMIEFDNYADIKEKYTYEHLQVLYVSSINVINELLKRLGNGVAFLHDHKEIVVLCNINSHSKKEFDQKVLEFTNELQRMIKNYISLSVSIGVSNAFNGLSNVKSAFQQAYQALNQRFLLGKGKTIKFESIQGSHEDLREKFPLQMEMLHETFESKKKEKIIEKVHGLFEVIRISHLNVQKEEICRLAIEIIIALLRTFRDEITLEDFFGNRHNMLNEVYKNETFNEVEQWLENIIAKLLDNVESDLRMKCSPIMAKAVEYIHKNYQNDISLLEIAEHVNMSKNYFSKVFREETGQNFVDYLAYVRVMHAKELLIKENMRVYEAAQLVGYNNYRYFCRIFKKIVGINPSEIKK